MLTSMNLGDVVFCTSPANDDCMCFELECCEVVYANGRVARLTATDLLHLEIADFMKKDHLVAWHAYNSISEPRHHSDVRRCMRVRIADTVTDALRSEIEVVTRTPDRDSCVTTPVPKKDTFETEMQFDTLYLDVQGPDELHVRMYRNAGSVAVFGTLRIGDELAVIEEFPVLRCAVKLLDLNEDRATYEITLDTTMALWHWKARMKTNFKYSALHKVVVAGEKDGVHLVVRAKDGYYAVGVVMRRESRSKQVRVVQELPLQELPVPARLVRAVSVQCGGNGRVTLSCGHRELRLFLLKVCVLARTGRLTARMECGVLLSCIANMAPEWVLQRVCALLRDRCAFRRNESSVAPW